MPAACASCRGGWMRRGFRGRGRGAEPGRPAVAPEGGVGRPAPSAADGRRAGSGDPRQRGRPRPARSSLDAVHGGGGRRVHQGVPRRARGLPDLAPDAVRLRAGRDVRPAGAGRIDEFTRSVGWCSQAELPRHYRAADICLVPTIAQDGLSITSVEAMASGIPVVASRIGGLPYTVTDGVTGLLCEPGDPADLARQIARLLDDPALRRRMGLAGRKRFEEDFTWETVIERYWRPLLAQRRRRRVGSRNRRARVA